MATNSHIGAYVPFIAPFAGGTVVSNTETACANADIVDLQHASGSVGVNPGTGRTTGVAFEVDFVKGLLTNVIIYVQISNDGGTTWYYCPEYQKTLTADGKLEIHVTPLNVTDTHARISAKSTGTTTGSALTISARLTGIYKVTA